MVKIYKQPFAHEGDAIEIPDAPQPDGKMSSVEGWTVDYQLPKTNPDYKPVGRREMNGVFKDVTEALGEMQVYGAAVWSADGAPYPINAQVYHDGKQWLALRANSVEPTEGEDWSAWDDSLRQDLANPDKGALLVRGAVIYVNTIADLEALDTSGLVDGQQVQVKEYHAGTSVGGGAFYWNLTSTDVHNGGTTFGTYIRGRWKRLYSGCIDITWFGAVGDGVTEASGSIQAAFNASNSVYMSAGSYLVSSVLSTPEGVFSLTGDGAWNTILVNEVPQGQAVLNVTSTGGFPSGRNGVFSKFLIHDISKTHGAGIRLMPSASWNQFREVECWGCEIGVEFTSRNIGNVFTKCTLKANQQHGVFDPVHGSALEESVATSFIGCNIEQSPICIHWNSGQTYINSGTVIEAFSDIGVETSKSIQITNSYFEGVDQDCIGIKTSGAGTSIIGCSILASGVNSIGVEFHGINTAIIGNTFGGGNGGYDFSVGPSGAAQSYIAGNYPSGKGSSVAGAVNLGYYAGNTASIGSLTVKQVNAADGADVLVRHNIKPNGNESVSLGGISNRYLAVWAKRAYLEIIPFAGAVTAASVSNNTLFLDSADNKLKYKDASGVANPLY